MDNNNGASEKKIEGALEDAAKKLSINLPTGKSPLSLRLIAFLTLLVGVNLMAGTFSDAKVHLFVYISKLFLGFVAVLIAYGIIERKRWAIWLYGFLAIVMLMINPIISILPIMIVIYLYFQRGDFEISIFDIFAEFLIKEAKIAFSAMINKIKK